MSESGSNARNIKIKRLWMSSAAQRLHNVLPGNPRQGGFTGGINFGYHNPVGGRQRAGEVGRKVRQTIRELGGTMPERLPVAENIKKVESREKKRLKAAQKKSLTANPPTET